eukprot:TRINITY_DN8428_c2_g1_i1.p1 TRINITY_DN8428_c2_g1~~TRINITY_DN8428_c2_g1_i1.p1  ORF type:complete len:233 (+),score=0.08 TRINITY_DN8428_c2_g1_i1:3-701(+)
MERDRVVGGVSEGGGCKVCLQCDVYLGNGKGPCSYCGCFQHSHYRLKDPDPDVERILDCFKPRDSRGVLRKGCLQCSTCTSYQAVRNSKLRVGGYCTQCFHPATQHPAADMSLDPLLVHADVGLVPSSYGHTDMLAHLHKRRTEKTVEMLKVVDSVYQSRRVIFDRDGNESITATFSKYAVHWYWDPSYGRMMQITFPHQVVPGDAEIVLRANIAIANRAFRMEGRFLVHHV